MRSLENFERLRSPTTSYSVIETETEYRAKNFAKSLSESIHATSNEPSLGFYRIEEHVKKSILSIISKKRDYDNANEKLSGINFDLENCIDTVPKLLLSKKSFDTTAELALKSLEALKSLNRANAPTINNPSSLKSRTTSILEQKLNFGSGSKTGSVSSSQSVLGITNEDQKIPKRSPTLLIDSSKPETSEIENSEPFPDQDKTD